MTEEIKHYQINGKYRVRFEQAASTKGVLGFVVEVNSDDMWDAEAEAFELLDWARANAPAEAKVKEVEK